MGKVKTCDSKGGTTLVPQMKVDWRELSELIIFIFYFFLFVLQIYASLI